ncbi:hypothetical protein IWW45_006841, partial [Coemansia sp. RSA 485]
VDTSAQHSVSELPASELHTETRPEPTSLAQLESSSHDNTHRGPEPSVPLPTAESHDSTPSTQEVSRTKNIVSTLAESKSSSHPQPTKPPANTQTRQSSRASSASKHTVVAVKTVIVDGETSLSSRTTVVDDFSVENTAESEDGNTSDTNNEVPYTTTIIEDGSAVVVTGLHAEESVSSDAQSSFAYIACSASIAGSVAAIAIAALF